MALCVFAAALCCTSSTTDAPKAADEDSGGAAPDAVAAGQDAAGTDRDGSRNDGSRNARDSGATASEDAAISDDCQNYCDCYEQKCSVFVGIPTGQSCPDFCSTFTTSQYNCRFGMCFYNSKGPAENNNNHCQHAVGIDECVN